MTACATEHEVAVRPVLIATGAQYRLLRVDHLDEYEGVSVFYAAGPPEAQLSGAERVAVVGGGNSAGQRRVARSGRRACHPVSPASGPARDDVRLPGARAQALRRGGARPQRDRRAPRHGRSARGGDAQERRAPAVSSLFLFLGALPFTEWLGDALGRDEDGFILTGSASDADNLLKSTVPAVFAAGDVRAGSTKRCASAVGEGAWAVQLVHAHLAARS